MALLVCTLGTVSGIKRRKCWQTLSPGFWTTFGLRLEAADHRVPARSIPQRTLDSDCDVQSKRELEGELND